MKLFKKTSVRCRAGITLIECLVYVAVFAVLLGIGTAAFYYCWDHTQATMTAADRIESALRAGEAWRADVRAATGRIAVTDGPDGETVEIPVRDGRVIYRCHDGELRRENSSGKISRVVLEKVEHSAMQAETRDGISAWRWELELKPPRVMKNFPLLFTFQSVSPAP